MDNADLANIGRQIKKSSIAFVYGENAERTTNREHASGVLIRQNEKRFIVTAKHCLFQQHDVAFAIFDEGHAPIRSRKATSIHSESDSDGIALIELHPQMSLPNIPCVRIAEYNAYDPVIVSGYPANRFEDDGSIVKVQFVAIPQSVACPDDLPAGLRIPFQPQVEFAIHFEQEMVDWYEDGKSSLDVLGDISGMSGGGVWQQIDGKVCLVGIIWGQTPDFVRAYRSELFHNIHH